MNTKKIEGWESKTKAQIAYYKSMVGKKGVGTPAWKGESARKETKHQWLNANCGKPTYCMSNFCEGKSTTFEWCLKTGRKYTHNPKDYLWLCRSCHRRYDLTLSKRLQAIKNLVMFNRFASKEQYAKKYRNLV